MLTLFVLMCLYVSVGSQSIFAQDVSLQYSNIMSLTNIFMESQYDVTDTFAVAAQSIINKDAALPIAVTAYSQPPDILLVSAAWSTGDVNKVTTDLQSVENMYNTWRVDDNSTLSIELSTLTRQTFGYQPTIIRATDLCDYGNEIVDLKPSNACWRNLTVTFLSTLSSDGVALRAALCTILPAQCDLIVLDSVASVSLRAPLSDTVTTYTQLNFQIRTIDRGALIATLLSYAQYASALSAQQVVFILINGAEVFSQVTNTPRYVEGDISDCLPRYWYLIFLIILLLVILIVSQQCYYRGRLSGRRSARKAEQEIRAGQHAAALMQNNFAYTPSTANYAYSYGPTYNQAGKYYSTSYDTSAMQGMQEQSIWPSREGGGG